MFAFSSCTALETIEVPDTLELIESSAFYGCSSLTTIDIPGGVTRIEDRAFEDCIRLTSIRVDENNQNYCSVDGVLFTKNKTELVTFPAGKKGSPYTVPDSVTSIGDYAFESCVTLESVTLPDNLKKIGYHAFYECSSLTAIDIPAGVDSINDSAFAGCSSLTSIQVDECNLNYCSVDGVLFAIKKREYELKAIPHNANCP